MRADIAVIDYGMGNLRSVSKALEHVAPAVKVVVTNDPETILSAGRVVFPGQGAAPDCMREIQARGLKDVIIEAAKTKPFLGICMGLQVLFEHSEEGDTPCLGVLPGRVLRFPDEAMHDSAGNRLKVPHMGWNEVHQAVPHPMWGGIADGSRFYFVHSYYVEAGNPDMVSSRFYFVHSYYVEAGNPDMVSAFTLYPFPFTSAVTANNIFAVQFHPEKSQAAGLALLGNFVTWDGNVAANQCDTFNTHCSL